VDFLSHFAILNSPFGTPEQSPDLDRRITMSHFYADLPPDIAALTDRQAVERYVAGAPVPAHSIQGLSHEQLNALPVPRTWSIQQIVLHLMDTDLIAAYRIKRIIAEEKPALDLYDENAFAVRLHYDKLEAKAAAEIFRLNRILTGQLLHELPDEAFRRMGLHQEMGEMSVSLFVRLYVKHVEHHMRFVTQKLELLGV
jgi:uncharacterized damage-inducible protein DinB